MSLRLNETAPDFRAEHRRPLPTYLRERARIIRLRHITPKDLAAAH